MSQTITQRPAGSRRILVLGFVLAALLSAATLMLAAKPARADLTLTVNSAGDPGSGGCNSSECTLREAIALANRVPGADTIDFDIPEGSTKRMLISPDLPTITEQVTIDGYSQPGARPNSRQTGGTDAVILIELTTLGGGLAARNGLEIAASNVVVRGLAINRFANDGIAIGAGTGTRIEGNFIGTDPSGTLDRGNAGNGVSIDNSENDDLSGAREVMVGGTTPDKRNLISGHDSGAAVFIRSEGGNKVQGNLIGTQKDGASPMSNTTEGVDVLFSRNNTVGGTEPGAANTIAFNSEEGVRVLGNGTSATGNRILGNSIFSNGGLGIDLDGGIEDADGRTANDRKDPDTGPNNLQNFPVLTSASTTAFKGTLAGTPKRTFTVQFFANPAGEDEGKTFLGETRATTNKKGTASFGFAAPVPGGTNNVTATATDANGNTSEFSAPRTISRS